MKSHSFILSITFILRETHYPVFYNDIPGVPGGKINILGGHIIGHSKQ